MLGKVTDIVLLLSSFSMTVPGISRSSTTQYFSGPSTWQDYQWSYLLITAEKENTVAIASLSWFLKEMKALPINKILSAVFSLIPLATRSLMLNEKEGLNM
jgi:ABC-type glycerol-3-phosphate transport system permease component